MKRVATEAEHPPVVGVPEVVRVTVVGVEPEVVVIVLNVEEVGVAVRVGCVYDAICATAS